jgi:hypothetical protein
MCHDINTKLLKDWFRHWKGFRGGIHTQTHSDRTSLLFFKIKKNMLTRINATVYKNIFIYGSTVLSLGLGCSYSYLILYTVCSTPLTGDEPVAGRYLHVEQYEHRIRAHRHPCLWVCFEPIILAFERGKTVHALHSAATVIGEVQHKIITCYVNLTLFCN